MKDSDSVIQIPLLHAPQPRPPPCSLCATNALVLSAALEHMEGNRAQRIAWKKAWRMGNRVVVFSILPTCVAIIEGVTGIQKSTVFFGLTALPVFT